MQRAERLHAVNHYSFKYTLHVSQIAGKYVNLASKVNEWRAHKQATT